MLSCGFCLEEYAQRIAANNFWVYADIVNHKRAWWNLEINVRHRHKPVGSWPTNEEKKDTAVFECLELLYAAYKRRIIWLLHIGRRNLYESILDLLIYNKKRAAELTVLGEKENCGAMKR